MEPNIFFLTLPKIKVTFSILKLDNLILYIFSMTSKIKCKAIIIRTHEPPRQASTCTGISSSKPSAPISRMGSITPWGYCGADPTSAIVLLILKIKYIKTSKEQGKASNRIQEHYSDRGIASNSLIFRRYFISYY